MYHYAAAVVNPRPRATASHSGYRDEVLQFVRFIVTASFVATTDLPAHFKREQWNGLDDARLTRRRVKNKTAVK